MTPEERAEWVLANDPDTSMVYRSCLRYLIAAAIREAVAERDFEWWEKLALVDNVAPTPEAVRDWNARLGQREVAEERERCLRKARSVSREEEICSSYDHAFGLAVEKVVAAILEGV